MIWKRGIEWLHLHWHEVVLPIIKTLQTLESDCNLWDQHQLCPRWIRPRCRYALMYVLRGESQSHHQQSGSTIRLKTDSLHNKGKGLDTWCWMYPDSSVTVWWTWGSGVRRDDCSWMRTKQKHLVRVSVFPDIAKDYLKIRNLPKIFQRSFENVALDN